MRPSPRWERVRRRNHVVLVDELRPGWHRDESRSRLAQRVVAATADLTLVGIGPPQQEILAHELKPVVTGPITDYGAVIAVLLGMRPRAPRALQLLGLELVVPPGDRAASVREPIRGRRDQHLSVSWVKR